MNYNKKAGIMFSLNCNLQPSVKNSPRYVPTQSKVNVPSNR